MCLLSAGDGTGLLKDTIYLLSKLATAPERHNKCPKDDGRNGNENVTSFLFYQSYLRARL